MFLLYFPYGNNQFNLRKSTIHTFSSMNQYEFYTALISFLKKRGFLFFLIKKFEPKIARNVNEITFVNKTK